MDLSKPSAENVEYMIDQLKQKLKMLNWEAMKPSHFSEEWYDELKEIFEMVMKRETFSPSEMQAIVEELGNLRKK
ncbi:DUF1128 domain-containing protein [Geobacillus sp. C56-T2]|uniref:DUF1128 domain-containing protein n=1 Tax=Geobacillus sp. C56-T2 TaxID=600773 RepID=UPI0011A5DE70|nr:DUF1128 domain-containing protein [Geobacillus sp. C56-T2]NNV06710.1 DUF1128 domain-containing protein [Geobacillus sp. MMMUD3]TWG29413.1 uncharacterized protein YfkK (UPF0435 family) [Geobacillus sp. C56-T2]